MQVKYACYICNLQPRDTNSYFVDCFPSRAAAWWGSVALVPLSSLKSLLGNRSM